MPLRLFDNPYVLLAVASLCWSGNHVLGRAIAGHVPPLGVSTLRWLLPSMALIPLALPHLRRDWRQIAAHWRILAFLSVMGGALFGALQYVGLQYTTALNVSVLNSLAPVFIVVAAALAFGDRISASQGLGIATSLTGVLVIVTRLDAETLTAVRFNVGDLIIVFNMACWAIYAVYLRRRPNIHWLSFIVVFGAGAAIATFPFAVWEHASGFVFQPTLLTVAAILYVATLPSFVAFAAWSRGTDLIGANRAGPFLHLVPLYSAVLAWALLGERLMAYHVLGFALILAGVWFAART
jgi:drug/metabolite transporter (DMT)-like permease